jgi:hypothetical protein
MWFSADAELMGGAMAKEDKLGQQCRIVQFRSTEETEEGITGSHRSAKGTANAHISLNFSIALVIAWKI